MYVPVIVCCLYPLSMAKNHSTPVLVQGVACIHGYTEAVEQPFLVAPFTRYPGDEEPQLKWWTAQGTARRAAELEKEVGHLQADEPATGDQNANDADASGSELGMEGAEIPKLPVYSQELLLGDADLHAMADLAHAVKHAIMTWQQNKKQKRQQTNHEFRRLGFRNVTEARQALSFLGRKGRPVWSSAYFKEHLPYIRPSSIVLLPPAHMLLHGLFKTFLGLSFGKWGTGWKTKDASEHKAFLFSSETIKAFQVMLTFYARCSESNSTISVAIPLRMLSTVMFHLLAG
jgi:hypothetical protein